MSVVPVARTQMGDAGLNGEWWADVNTGTTAAPVWLPINAIYDFKDGLDSKEIDVSDFSSDGWADSQNVGKSWSVDMKVWRKRQRAAAAHDPGQEFLRLRAGASVEIRFYLMNSATMKGPTSDAEAYQGLVSVKWSPDGGKVDDARSVSVTLTGKGKRTSITHPAPYVATP